MRTRPRPSPVLGHAGVVDTGDARSPLAEQLPPQLYGKIAARPAGYFIVVSEGDIECGANLGDRRIRAHIGEPFASTNLDASGIPM